MHYIMSLSLNIIKLKMLKFKRYAAFFVYKAKAWLGHP